MNVSPTAEIAVRRFMQAVTDSDVAGMGRLWGTTRGSAAATRQPPDYEKRMTIAQLFLRGATYEIAGVDSIEAPASRKTVQVKLNRTQCNRTVPFVVVNAGSSGWLVSSIDLNAAGTPGRPCDSRTAP